VPSAVFLPPETVHAPTTETASVAELSAAELSAAELSAAELSAAEESALLLELVLDEESALLLELSPQAANDITIVTAKIAARIFFIVFLSFHYRSESRICVLPDFVDRFDLLIVCEYSIYYKVMSRLSGQFCRIDLKLC
jgi:hypothetical protein